ncbi:MAG: response regulator, partial [Chloroflexi bacterium]|nr:response regulator [Chloroflexota bacterium]
ELRMPLTSVMGAGTTLLNAAADLDPAEMRQFHRIIVDRAEHMRYLIGDLLDVARIETGALPVDPEPSDLHPLVEEAGGRFRSADARNPLEMELAEGLPLVMADRRRIVQVLGNLFSNAAGYSPEGSPFTLPAVKQPAPPAPGPASTGSRRTPRVRVLAVDDNPQDLRYVRDVLARAGYVPVATGDPADVPRLLSEEKPHLALLDLVLPGSDGIALMNDIRKTADVPVIFLSMYGQDETVARALDMGAADYVVKPFSPTELAARIRAALRKRLEPFQGEPSGPYGAGGLGIDYALRRVTLDGEPVELTATEYAVLYELTVHAPRTLTHAVLLQRIWGPEKVGEPWLVRDMVRRLRRKLGDNADNPRHIITEPRVGYRMAEGEASGEGKEP